MRWYKFYATNKKVGYTTDKILSDFMNKHLTLWQRITLFFHL